MFVCLGDVCVCAWIARHLCLQNERCCMIIVCCSHCIFLVALLSCTVYFACLVAPFILQTPTSSYDLALMSLALVCFVYMCICVCVVCWRWLFVYLCLRSLLERAICAFVYSCVVVLICVFVVICVFVYMGGGRRHHPAALF